MAAGAESLEFYRWGGARDASALADIMFEAIHDPRSPYRPEQRAAWCPAPPSGPEWQDKLDRQSAAVVDIDGPVGFLTLAQGGYLDLAYLTPKAQGQGYLRVLHAMIKIRARILGWQTLSTHASLSAQGPFSSLGYKIVQHEEVIRRGQTLRRAEMRLEL